MSKFKMADSVAGLRQLVIREIENICSSLSTEPTQQFDTLEKIDQVVVAINFLDSVVRLPEDVYGDISAARRILENLSSTSVRTPQISSNMPGRPCYEITVDQLQSLVDLRFTVPQIARLLHVSTRTIERRLAEITASHQGHSPPSRMRSWMAMLETSRYFILTVDQRIWLVSLHLVT